MSRRVHRSYAVPTERSARHNVIVAIVAEHATLYGALCTEDGGRFRAEIK